MCVPLFKAKSGTKSGTSLSFRVVLLFLLLGAAGAETFFGLFPLVYERKTLEMSLWPAETRTLPLRTFRFRGMIIVHRFSGSAPVPP